MFAFAWSIGFITARVLLVCRLIASGSWVGVGLGLSEAWAVASSLRGMLAGRFDASWSGLLVPVCYLGSVLFVAQGAALFAGASVVFGVLLAVKVLVRCWLGWCCTVAAPSFLWLVSSGPYALIRHPLALVELLVSVAFFCCHASSWNAAVLGLRLVLGVLCIWCEERFLFGCPGYESYAARVRWRWVPGLW